MMLEDNTCFSMYVKIFISVEFINNFIKYKQLSIASNLYYIQNFPCLLFPLIIVVLYLIFVCLNSASRFMTLSHTKTIDL